MSYIKHRAPEGDDEAPALEKHNFQQNRTELLLTKQHRWQIHNTHRVTPAAMHEEENKAEAPSIRDLQKPLRGRQGMEKSCGTGEVPNLLWKVVSYVSPRRKHTTQQVASGVLAVREESM